MPLQVPCLDHSWSQKSWLVLPATLVGQYLFMFDKVPDEILAVVMYDSKQNMKRVPTLEQNNN